MVGARNHLEQHYKSKSSWWLLVDRSAHGLQYYVKDFKKSIGSWSLEGSSTKRDLGLEGLYSIMYYNYSLVESRWWCREEVFLLGAPITSSISFFCSFYSTLYIVYIHLLLFEYACNGNWLITYLGYWFLVEVKVIKL